VGKLEEKAQAPMFKGKSTSQKRKRRGGMKRCPVPSASLGGRNFGKSVMCESFDRPTWGYGEKRKLPACI